MSRLAFMDLPVLVEESRHEIVLAFRSGGCLGQRGTSMVCLISRRTFGRYRRKYHHQVSCRSARVEPTPHDSADRAVFETAWTIPASRL